ncbi:hypothetical protein GCM10025793_21930 [Lysobacter lycopersici]
MDLRVDAALRIGARIARLADAVRYRSHVGRGRSDDPGRSVFAVAQAMSAAGRTRIATRHRSGRNEIAFTGGFPRCIALAGGALVDFRPALRGPTRVTAAFR